MLGITAKEIAEKEVTKLNKDADVNEAYFVGLCWREPFKNYSEYKDTIDYDEFVHDVWGFYFYLGKQMFEEGIVKFDDISVMKFVEQNDITSVFEKYNGLTTIKEAMDIVGNYSENAEHYYDTIKKNSTMRGLYSLFGYKVFVDTDEYNWKEMPREIVLAYWNDRLNLLSMDVVNNHEAENLYITGDEFIQKSKEESADMLPFFDSYLFNNITQGIPRGHVTMLGGFGNTGKTSFMADKIAMSMIYHGEKTIIVLNEEDAQQFRQKIILSILNYEYDTQVSRKSMITGDFTEEEEVLVNKAFEKMNEYFEGKDSIVKVLFMERYVMKDLEKIIRFWVNRGYDNLIVDTHKVSEDSKHGDRWVTFVEDMKTIYRLTRKNAGGLNLRTVVTFQLADHAILNRYLDFDAIGEGKASKNEASIVLMYRPLFTDEYDKLECFRKRKDKISGKYFKEPIELDKTKTYYLFFTPKNRFGQNNENGQEVLIVNPFFPRNAFQEVGWTYVPKDSKRR